MVESQPRDVTYYMLNHVAPALGSLLGVMLFLSPRPDVLAARERGSLGTLNPWPFVFIVLHCCGMLVYAAELRDWYLFVSSVPGLLIGVWYVMQCLPLISDPVQRAKVEWATMLSIMFWVLVGEVRVLAFGEREGAGVVLAWLTVFGLVMLYGSPLTTMVLVIRSRDSASILPKLALISVVTSVCWTCYGVFAAHNLFIAGPNAAGALLSLVQLALRALYPAKQGGSPLPAEKPFGATFEIEAIRSAIHQGDQVSPMRGGHIALVPVAVEGAAAAESVFRLEQGEAGRFDDGLEAGVPSGGYSELPLDGVLPGGDSGALGVEMPLGASPSMVELLPQRRDVEEDGPAGGAGGTAAAEEDRGLFGQSRRGTVDLTGTAPPRSEFEFAGEMGEGIGESHSRVNLLGAMGADPQ
jgi:solute carrier family 50 protein (sugar transporter)